MFQTRMNASTCKQCRCEVVVDKTYGNQGGRKSEVRRLIPWLVALAITAVALIALADGYFA